MNRMFKVLLTALIVGCLFGCPAYAGTDTYYDGEWRITSDGDLIPVTNNASAIGNSSYYPVNITLDSKAKSFWGKVSNLTTSSTMPINFANASVFKITPTMPGTFTTTGTGGIPGTIGTLVITSSGTQHFNLVFGTGFKSSGTIGTGVFDDKVTTVQFVSDGVNWNEVARATGM